ncbi:hypothetical protein [Ruegeria sp. HKCCD7318]|uniref:hypothetical protein n=1 Tax=Ruegeria sp. HKCCD7318 TaxID=2683014 RepID=UPI001493163D|nr:hypothetical protein [Ruegeria sp. HKCCD7318]NOE32499.1 hypothetical protein [Ruegeria sp. HKCCD7318]
MATKIGGNGFEIQGFAELQKGLLDLPTNVAVNVGRRGVAVAAREMRTAVRRKAVKGKRKYVQYGYAGPGRLRKSIHMWQPRKRQQLKKAGAIARVYLGDPSRSKKGRLNFYRLLETGRSAGGRDKRGRKLGAYPKKPFWHGTIKENTPKALQTMITSANAQLVKEALKIYRKTLKAPK